jgi:hypothetical protein
MFFELIVNYERAREKHLFLVKINFFNFMALNEVRDTEKLIAHV